MKASVDIGTNSVLLLVCEMSGGSLHVLHEKQALPRLGRGVDNDKNLHTDSCKRVLQVLGKYRSFLSEIDAKLAGEVVVTATSAVRDAANRDEFMKQVKEKTGWDVKLLSGREEAVTTYRGALSVLENRRNRGNMIVDIGGGSTEIAYGKGNQLKYGISIDMGSVRFTERFIRNNPPKKLEIERIRCEIRTLLLNASVPEEEDADLIGVAGTVTSIAAIHQNMNEYDANVLNGCRLSRKELASSIAECSVLPYEELEKKYPPFLTGRGEVILAGALILDEILQWFHKDCLTVSTGGIRHGILLENVVHDE